MQFIIEETTQPNVLKNSVMSIPNSLSGTVLSKNIETEACYCIDNFHKNLLMTLWNKQHPLIHTWLLLSSISICFLSALFFIFP